MAFNKARFDAETFWYQGNGSVDIIADHQFNALEEKDRNVILYGNADGNSAWRILLKDSPVQVNNGRVTFGKRRLIGDGYACLFIRPRLGSDNASVGAVAGSGLAGMRLTDNRPYLYPGYAYPDVTIFDKTVISKGTDGITVAGYFGIDWTIESGEFVCNWEDDSGDR
ncbi:hypothetical protein JXO59_08705 [candidate division KSB1 bacterium]|nr:hypothetical protein [candidate division KSB1 bacterium]